ncbi:hypothetical protein C8R45DRAFT_1011189 [Mycena sanguinolenta]|nr:hypothetical protein C8R45DRAFT_1011189 [Mycena sanguinolenta]
MARDFLAIPGTSLFVERLFSRSRHLCHEARPMKAETITQGMLTKMWIKFCASCLPIATRFVTGDRKAPDIQFDVKSYILIHLLCSRRVDLSRRHGRPTFPGHHA